MNNTRRIQTVIGAMVVAGTASAVYAAIVSHSLHAYLGLAILTLAVATSRMKVKLPGVNGNMSVNLPFLLTAAITLSGAEAVVIACISTAVQCWPRKNTKFNSQQMAFNLSMMAFATSVAGFIFRASWLQAVESPSTTLGLVLATVTLFLGQTVPVACIVGASEGKSASAVWWNLVQLSFPYYVVSAGVTSMVQTVSTRMGWELALAVFPVMYGIHRSYELYFGNMAELSRPEPLVRAARAGA
jgi:hypothetical protein